MTPARLLATLLAPAVLLAGCSSPDVPERAERSVEDLSDTRPSPIERYVALGDSFTAAPLVPTTDVAEGCFRSNGNYPSLVAERLDVDRLVDVSCSGAQTSDLTQRQRTVGGTRVAPQLDAVTASTDLVTLGIGGNDFDLFGTLVQACTQAGREDPTGSPCTDRLDRHGVDLVGLTDQISERVERALDRIQQKAPDATVLLVGYPRLVPSEGRCPELPFAGGDYRRGARIGRALDDALARAADRAGVGYVDMYTASKGHDICAEDPWVNGARTRQDQALAYHPFAAGMEAVTERIVGRLSR